MHNLNYILLALVVSIGTVRADEPNPLSIDKLMSPEEFEAAGLQKLNDVERAALESWLVRYTAIDAPKVAKVSKAVQAVADARLRGRLLGEFSGWQGKSVFNLDNGERWRQIGQDQYYPRKKLMKPAVTIHRSAFGGHSLEILETGVRVKVRRIN